MKGFDIAIQRRLYFALKKIAREYMPPDQLRRDAERSYGLNYVEALEMAYENMQTLAADTIRGLRVPNEQVAGVAGAEQVRGIRRASPASSVSPVGEEGKD